MRLPTPLNTIYSARSADAHVAALSAARTARPTTSAVGVASSIRVSEFGNGAKPRSGPDAPPLRSGSTRIPRSSRFTQHARVPDINAPRDRTPAAVRRGSSRSTRRSGTGTSTRDRASASSAACPMAAAPDAASRVTTGDAATQKPAVRNFVRLLLARECAHRGDTPSRAQRVVRNGAGSVVS